MALKNTQRALLKQKKANQAPVVIQEDHIKMLVARSVCFQTKVIPSIRFAASVFLCCDAHPVLFCLLLHINVAAKTVFLGICDWNVSSLHVSVDECSAKNLNNPCFLPCRLQSNTRPSAQKISKNSRLFLRCVFSSKNPVYSDPSRGAGGRAGKPVIDRKSSWAELKLSN